MKKEADRKHWEEMRRKLIDPEEQAKARRQKEREERIKEEIRDTGYDY